jgi:hypothetical protein
MAAEQLTSVGQRQDRTDRAMHRCEHCSSATVRWFTPERSVGYGAVLLCLACSRLTIVVSGYARGRDILSQDRLYRPAAQRRERLCSRP